METKEQIKEILIIFIGAIILAFSIAYPEITSLPVIFISIFFVIVANILVKKLLGYSLEADVKTKFWSIYQHGLKSKAHFKKPFPMLWLPLLVSYFSRGLLYWLPIFQFDITPRIERVSKRHGLYRFSEMTEWHVALIAASGIATNIILGFIAYFLGWTIFLRLNIYYALWSLIPISNLDGSKIFFGSRKLWTALAITILLIFIWGITIF